jgi:hypothetical protein
MKPPPFTFGDIISPHDQYICAQARADIAFRIHIGCLVAYGLKDIIWKRIPY